VSDNQLAQLGGWIDVVSRITGLVVYRYRGADPRWTGGPNSERRLKIQMLTDADLRGLLYRRHHEDGWQRLRSPHSYEVLNNCIGWPESDKQRFWEHVRKVRDENTR